MNYWQTYNFAPFEDPAVAKPGPDPRIEVAAKFLDWIRVRAPGFIGGHPMYVDEIEEELYLLDSGFNSLYNHAAFLHVPSYIGWVLGLVILVFLLLRGRPLHLFHPYWWHL